MQRHPPTSPPPPPLAVQSPQLPAFSRFCLNRQLYHDDDRIHLNAMSSSPSPFRSAYTSRFGTSTAGTTTTITTAQHERVYKHCTSEETTNLSKTLWLQTVKSLRHEPTHARTRDQKARLAADLSEASGNGQRAHWHMVKQ